jgi:hypothetical protein
MTRSIVAATATVLLLNLAGPTRADQKEAEAILDKGIQALGGREKLEKADAMRIHAKGRVTIQGSEDEESWKTIIQGMDHSRTEIKRNEFEGVFVVAGDKGWGTFPDGTRELDGEFLAGQKRSIYLVVVSTRLVPLKGKGFTYETAGEEQVDGKPAAGLRCTGPDGKDFTLFFDKESGLPVLLKARISVRGQGFDQETRYLDYKDFDGIKKATRTVARRNGEPFLTQEVTEFKVLDKVDPDTFAEPK